MSECNACVRIKGVLYPCDVEGPHPGLAHGNEEAGAHWISDGEARAAKRKKTLAVAT